MDLRTAASTRQPEPCSGHSCEPTRWLKTSAFLEALPAFLPPDQASQQRLPDLLETLRAITALAEP
jgi:hypothetical protein